MNRWVLPTLLLLLAAACATMKNDQTVCPEFRNIRCAGRTVCDMDQSRGCRVCRCEDATAIQPAGPPENPNLPGN